MPTSDKAERGIVERGIVEQVEAVEPEEQPAKVVDDVWLYNFRRR